MCERNAKEKEKFDPNSLGIATTTFYKKWYVGDLLNPEEDVDKIRGDIAIRMFRSALERGYQIVNIDGGSSTEFIEEVDKLKVKLIKPGEAESGMSPSRRQAFREVSKLTGVKVILWTEPEKISMVEDCLEDATMPIINGDADMVVPHRTKESFDTYPKFQADSEQAANNDWNGILRHFNILKSEDHDLDVFFGPKLFKNTPDMVSLFLARYGFDERNKTINSITKVENYSNATFFPVIAALECGLRVVSVDVDYRHPEIQTMTEKDSPYFVKKRKTQRSQIVSSAVEFCRFLNDHAKSRIVKYD